MKRFVYRLVYLYLPRVWFLWAYRVENLYQTYVYSPTDLSPFGETRLKFEAIAPVFTQLVNKRTLVEFGCDAGYFVLHAGMVGATQAVGVDRNPKALARAERARDVLTLGNVAFRHGAVPDLALGEAFDVVLLMSAIHYMFSNKQGNRLLFESMDSLIAYLGRHAKTHLLIEFVDPNDRFAQELVADELLQSGEYSARSFHAALKHHFDGIVELGRTHRETRTMYLAYRGPSPV